MSNYKLNVTLSPFIYLPPILINVDSTFALDVKVNSSSVKGGKSGLLHRARQAASGTLANGYHSPPFTYARTRTNIRPRRRTAPRLVIESSECRVASRRRAASRRAGASVVDEERRASPRHGKESYARCPRFSNGTYYLRERWHECARGCCIGRIYATRRTRREQRNA